MTSTTEDEFSFPAPEQPPSPPSTTPPKTNNTKLLIGIGIVVAAVVVVAVWKPWETKEDKGEEEKKTPKKPKKPKKDDDDVVVVEEEKPSIYTRVKNIIIQPGPLPEPENYEFYIIAPDGMELATDAKDNGDQYNDGKLYASGPPGEGERWRIPTRDLISSSSSESPIQITSVASGKLLTAGVRGMGLVLRNLPSYTPAAFGQWFPTLVKEEMIDGGVSRIYTLRNAHMSTKYANQSPDPPNELAVKGAKGDTKQEQFTFWPAVLVAPTPPSFKYYISNRAAPSSFLAIDTDGRNNGINIVTTDSQIHNWEFSYLRGSSGPLTIRNPSSGLYASAEPSTRVWQTSQRDAHCEWILETASDYDVCFRSTTKGTYLTLDPATKFVTCLGTSRVDGSSQWRLIISTI